MSYFPQKIQNGHNVAKLINNEYLFFSSTFKVGEISVLNYGGRGGLAILSFC